MSYLTAASLIYHTWTAWTFKLPREIFLCAHMCIYHFVMVLARFFSFHPHIPGMCLWEIWLGYCGFFIFSNQTLWRVEAHTSKLLCGRWRCRPTVCQLLCVTPGSPSMREKAGSAHWQPADTCTPTQNRPSTTLECELHTETFLTIPHFVPSLFCSLSLTARSHCVLFLLIKHFRVMPGLCSPSQQSTREVRELSWAPGGGKKEIKRLPLPFADASLKMLWLRALCCHYSNLPCAIPGIHARVCGALHCSSLLLSLPKYSFPGYKQQLLM